MGEIVRTGLRWLLTAIYLYVGIAHLRTPEPFLAIMPQWVPFPQQVVALTGIWEIIGAVLLMTPKFRRAAGWMLAAYAVAVYPANIRHAVEGLEVNGVTLDWRYHVPRLLFQPVFVWWALFAGGIIDWPMRKKSARSAARP
ncbi:DoxX family protein [Pacificimonas sp. WHA3]|uniref:DoxX family protein n=1 Tax=Pacificimonas pallii TaxID=2827236 RepID=A0ABS6SGR0_9SPHN|nr:DoxX family protein [Pacificimonas pallii]MBV7257223.1 DoxX family protein [Pacificimonas pallii]